MSDDLKEIARAVQHIRPGMECRFAEWVWLPFWQFSPVYVWASGRGGPRELDEIFFGLLRHGVNSRKDIALRLGVDEDEFVFAHLDILVREGYASENDGKYELTELGRQFVVGEHLEERMKRIRFSFAWDDMSACIAPELSLVSDPKDGQKVKHRAERPDVHGRLNELAEYFNARHVKNNMKFYDIDLPPSGVFSYEKLYAKYAALFYAPGRDSEEGEWRVDLRAINADVRGDEVIEKFSPCEDLSEKAKEEYWREQFENIYKSGVRAAR